MRRLLLAAAALLCAAAGPFDQYQLIMWQEHSPAQRAGLAQLGFTGIKLRATGGQVDPAELAAAIASGLPWYLENVATDFYSPYHRYAPGKSVTWLFDAAKARLRADPADTSVFVREPSLSDAMWQQRVADRVQALARAQHADHPLFYNLADEPGIGDLAAAWDADISPPALAAFRDWLRTQYPSLAALNTVWGTRFERWDAVMPELTDAALRRTDGNFAAWGDFKAWMDIAFADAVRAGTAALHAADPGALAAIEGGQVPGWGGYDYGLLARAVDVMEIYDVGDSVALARAANPDLKLLRTSFGPGDQAEAWRNLLQGGRGTIVWDEDDGVVAADGSPKPRGRELAALVAGLRAVAPAVMAARPDPDPVAVFVSQASFRAQWLLDRRAGDHDWVARSAGREYEDNAWRAARREALQRLHGIGLEPRLLLSLAGDALTGMKVLILPDAIALSEAEVASIRAFAASGGTVLADTEPGLYDGHLHRRPAPPLADVAPVKEAMQRTGMPPGAGTLDGEAGLLAAAGITPRVLLRMPEGGRATGLEARWLRNGTQRLLSVQPIAPDSAPSEIDLILPAPATIHDLRKGSPPRRTDHLRLTLDRAEPTILSLEP